MPQHWRPFQQQQAWQTGLPHRGTTWAAPGLVWKGPASGRPLSPPLLTSVTPLDLGSAKCPGQVRSLPQSVFLPALPSRLTCVLTCHQRIHDDTCLTAWHARFMLG